MNFWVCDLCVSENGKQYFLDRSIYHKEIKKQVRHLFKHIFVVFTSCWNATVKLLICSSFKNCVWNYLLMKLNIFKRFIYLWMKFSSAIQFEKKEKVNLNIFILVICDTTPRTSQSVVVAHEQSTVIWPNTVMPK